MASLLTGAAVTALLAGSPAFGAEAPEGVPSVSAARQPIVVHDKTGGWAESPALEATASDAFVAYEVTHGTYSRIYLARIPRVGGVAGRPNAKIRIDGGREVAAWPSVALGTTEDSEGGCKDMGRSQADRIWVAWSSYRNGHWAIKACLVECAEEMRTLSCTTLSAPGGFQSQVRVKSACGMTCFVWARWDRETYSILARTNDGKMGELLKVYEGPSPVGRPDFHIMSRDRIVFTWDEYVDGGFAVRTREMAGANPGVVRTIDGPSCDITGGGMDAESGHETAGVSGIGSGWEPRLAGCGDNFILAWNAVPAGSPGYEPRALVSEETTFDPAAASLPTEDTWRVRCFCDSDGRLYLAWTTRFFFRSTDLFIRRMTPQGMEMTQRFSFPLEKNFMNTFDCEMDRDLLVAWDYSGAIYLAQVDSSEFDAAAGLTSDAGERGGSLVESPGAPREPLDPGDWADSASDEAAWAGGGEVRGTLASADAAAEWMGTAEGHAVFYEGESLHVYFGDCHNHTSFSDGRACPDISLLIAKDSRRLDFAAITDHDVTASPGELAWTRTVAEYLSVPGNFAALHGFEASKGWAQHGFGHWTVLFRGAGEVLHFEPTMTPPDLYGFVRRLDAIAIPHHVAKRFAPHNWDYFDPTAESVVEMCSLHGIFESLRGNEGRFGLVEGSFVEDGLARGYVFGFVGGSDSHNCFEAAILNQGLTGIYAKELTPAAILDAMARRRTFALTAGRTILDFRCNGRLMGEVVLVEGDHRAGSRAGRVRRHGAKGNAQGAAGEGSERGGLIFTGYASSSDSIVSAEIISGGQVAYRSDKKAPEVAISWEAAAPDSQVYYYLRVTTSKGGFAWSSPIWIKPQR